MVKLCTKCARTFEIGEGDFCPECGGQLTDITDSQGSPVFARLIYFCVNTFLMMGLMWKYFLSWGLGKIPVTICSVIGILLVGSILFSKKRNGLAPCESLADLIFGDVLVMAAIMCFCWFPERNSKDFSYFYSEIGSSVFAVILGFWLNSQSEKKNQPILRFFAFEAFGTLLIYWWGWGLPQITDWNRYMFVYFLVYTVLNFTWFTAGRCVLAINYGKRKQLNHMSFVLFLVLVLVRAFYFDQLSGFIVKFSIYIQDFVSSQLGIGKLIVTLMILLVAALLLGAVDRRRCGCDALIITGIAGALILLKVTTLYYTPFGLISFLIYGTGVWKFVESERTGESEYDVNRAILLLVFTFFLSVAVRLVSMGLWPMVLLGMLFAWFYTPKYKLDQSRFPYLAILFWIVAEAGLAVLYFKFHIRILILIGVLALPCLIMLKFVNWEHPSLELPWKGTKRAICLVLACLLFFLISGNNGAVIQTTYLPESDSISVSVTARDKEGKLAEAYYYWIEGVQWNPFSVPGSKQRISSEETEIAAQKGTLMVVAVDENGVVTRKAADFPLFFYHAE